MKSKGACRFLSVMMRVYVALFFIFPAYVFASTDNPNKPHIYIGKNVTVVGFEDQDIIIKEVKDVKVVTFEGVTLVNFEADQQTVDIKDETEVEEKPIIEAPKAKIVIKKEHKKDIEHISQDVRQLTSNSHNTLFLSGWKNGSIASLLQNNTPSHYYLVSSIPLAVGNWNSKEHTNLLQKDRLLVVQNFELFFSSRPPPNYL